MFSWKNKKIPDTLIYSYVMMSSGLMTGQHMRVICVNNYQEYWFQYNYGKQMVQLPDNLPKLQQEKRYLIAHKDTKSSHRPVIIPIRPVIIPGCLHLKTLWIFGYLQSALWRLFRLRGWSGWSVFLRCICNFVGNAVCPLIYIVWI